MAITSAVYRQTMTETLRGAYGSLRGGVKRLATDAGVSTRTAENWLDALCAPQGNALMNLAARCKDVDAAVERMKAMARGEP